MQVSRREFITRTAALAAAPMLAGDLLAADRAQKTRPNVVYILADDQGYGDAQSFNPGGLIPTPGIDRLAREGMRFTDAHSASAVCTPTRYGLLTGRYSWRTRLQSGVLKTGTDPLIDPATLTVQGLFKQHGYKTACVGKWHLGFHYDLPEGTEMIFPKGERGAAPVGSRVLGGPVARDFDEFAGFHHAREMRTWIEQDTVVANLESSEEMLPMIGARSIQYIRQQGDRQDQPFFLYVPLSAPHGPIVPTKEWQGRSGLGAYADFVMQTDDVVGRILDTLDEVGLADDTMVFFATDNGTAPVAKIDALRKQGHDPLGGLRGHKADAWDGGHRVPFVVRWPGVVTQDSICNETICLNSLLATCADLVQSRLPDSAGVDSFSIMPLLQGRQAETPTHPYVIHHSIKGHFAIRRGKWKFVACKGSGGWSKGDDGQPAQLYDMAADRAEKNNLLELETGVARDLADLLERAVAQGRTRPGPAQANDVAVDIWKTEEGRPRVLRG